MLVLQKCVASMDVQEANKLLQTVQDGNIEHEIAIN